MSYCQWEITVKLSCFTYFSPGAPKKERIKLSDDSRCRSLDKASARWKDGEGRGRANAKEKAKAARSTHRSSCRVFWETSTNIEGRSKGAVGPWAARKQEQRVTWKQASGFCVHFEDPSGLKRQKETRLFAFSVPSSEQTVFFTRKRQSRCWANCHRRPERAEKGRVSFTLLLSYEMPADYCEKGLCNLRCSCGPHRAWLRRFVDFRI